MAKRKYNNSDQLSLFDPPAPETAAAPSAAAEPTTIYDFIRARLDKEPEMSQEEYKRWIKILVQSSLKRFR